MVKNKESKGKYERETVEHFMQDMFQNYQTTKTHIDQKVNWLLGISALIMSATLSALSNHELNINRYALFVIFITALFSFLICLITLDIPSYFTKHIKPTENNLMFYKTFKNKTTEEIYAKLKSMNNFDDVIMQYSIHFHDLVGRNLSLKKKFFMLARDILFWGMIAGLAVLIFSNIALV